MSKSKPAKRLNTHFEPYPHEYRHRAVIGQDDGEPITFKWHWPRGTFDARMSAYELAAFVLPHMPSIVPLLGNHPRVQREFQAMLVVLATSPREAIDRLVPWIKPVIKTCDDDIIEMSVGAVAPQPVGPTYFT